MTCAVSLKKSDNGSQMKLILNADDFGLTEQVNQAILKTMTTGIVRSTTIMMNQPGTQNAISLAKDGLVKELGLHLNLTAGQPLSSPDKLPDLTGKNGQFFHIRTLETFKEVDTEQVYFEIKAQYQAALHAGLEINHLDCHHFSAILPTTREAFITLANETGLPCRRIDLFIEGQDGLTSQTPEAFDYSFFDKGVDAELFKASLLNHKKKRPNACVEYMCHPGYANDEVLRSLSSYVSMREKELNLLTNVHFMQWLETNEIEPIGYEQLTKRIL